MKRKSYLASILSVLLTFFVSFSLIAQIHVVSAYEPGEAQKFETDSVIVTLTKEATLRFLTYTPDSFPEIGCVLVEDLTQFTVEWVKSQFLGEPTEDVMMVDVENFLRILRLELMGMLNFI